MPASRRPVRAAAAACLLALTATACTGRNDGGRDAHGGSSDGVGGTPPAGPRAGQSTDTTTGPAGMPAQAVPAAGTSPAGTPPAGTPPAGAPKAGVPAPKS
jgi:hypothetical protein